MIKIGIVGKIWLGMAIMIAGFLAIIGLGWGNSFLLGKRLDAVKKDFYPAVVAGTNASGNFKQLLEHFNRGVILAEPQIIDESAASLNAVIGNLEVITRNMGTRVALRTEAEQLGAAITSYYQEVAPLYKRLSEGQEPAGDLSPRQLAKHAMRGRELQGRAETLHKTLVNDFNTELSAINSKLQQQQQLNIILFVMISVVSGVAAFYVITRKVKEPVQLTVRAANKIADGNYAERLSIASNDEIGELGGAFNKMAQHLEETLSGLRREVAERTRAEEALRTNEENLRITLDSIGDAVIATDTQERVVRINPVAASVMEWAVDDAIGKDFGEIFRTQSGNAWNPVSEILEKDEAIGLSTDTTVVTKSGVQKKIADSGAPIRNAAGETVGVVITFRDITEQLAKEEQLRQAQKMDSVGQLAGGVAHDFNNMLGGIIGAAELLRRRLGDDKKKQRLVDMIISAADNAGDLTQKLLAFSRKGNVNSVSMDAHEPVLEAIALLERSIDKRIHLEFEGKAGKRMIRGDRSQLQNTFLNLGINARDALPDGGYITFSTENVDLDKAFCDQSAFELVPGPYVKLSVKDDGVGMPPEVQARVFEPFFTTKEVGRGTGLGLAAVYGCVKEHSGAIELRSAPGKGTEFEILLPVDECSLYHDVTETESTFKGDGCVLLVDDEEIIRKSAAMLLNDMGYRVVTANDGRQAVAVFEEKMDEIDLVILDMIMPEMNGLECFKAIRKMNPGIDVVIASGFTQPEHMADLREEGVEAFLRKPFRFQELVRVLKEFQERRHGGNEL